MPAQWLRQTICAGLALPPFDVEPHGQKKVKHFPGLNKETKLICFF